MPFCRGDVCPELYDSINAETKQVEYSEQWIGLSHLQQSNPTNAAVMLECPYVSFLRLSVTSLVLPELLERFRK